MPRSNKRNAKARAMRKTQQDQSKPVKTKKEKQAEYDDNIRCWESSRDEVPTTSKQVASRNSKRTQNLEATASSTSVNVNKKAEREQQQQQQLSVSTKRKRKPINRLICFTDSDDDEPIIGPPTMRYVDVARSALLGTDKAVQTQKSTTQLIDMGLEEFPLLQPSKLPSSEVYNRNSDARDSDSSVQASFADLNETDLSDMTECFLMDDKEQVFEDMEAMDGMEAMEAMEGMEAMEEPNNTAEPIFENICIEPSSDGLCGVEAGSSSGSYWAEASNETNSENETISCTDDGGGDAGYAYNCENECPQPPSSPPPPPPPQTSTFSQEWLDTTVRSLALPFGVSIPSFNFLQPDINFSRFERQFDDAHYKRMEDRAMFSLRLALNKSFFRDGNYM